MKKIKPKKKPNDEKIKHLFVTEELNLIVCALNERRLISEELLENYKGDEAKAWRESGISKESFRREILLCKRLIDTKFDFVIKETERSPRKY